MWQDILNYTLNFFASIPNWVNFLFTDYELQIDKPSNEMFQFLFGWFVDWVNGWQLVFKPIEILGVETFLVFFAIFLIKLIF